MRTGSAMKQKARLMHCAVGLCVIVATFATESRLVATELTVTALVTNSAKMTIPFGPDPDTVKSRHSYEITSISAIDVGKVFIWDFTTYQGNTVIYQSPIMSRSVPGGTYGISGHMSRTYYGDCHSLAGNWEAQTMGDIGASPHDDFSSFPWTVVCGCQDGPPGPGDPYH